METEPCCHTQYEDTWTTLHQEMSVLADGTTCTGIRKWKEFLEVDNGTDFSINGDYFTISS